MKVSVNIWYDCSYRTWEKIKLYQRFLHRGTGKHVVAGSAATWQSVLLPPAGSYTGRDSFAFLPLCGTSKNQGSRQFLNWLQQYAPGILRFNLSSPHSVEKHCHCPCTLPGNGKGISNYEYERTDDGDIISGYPDENNHSIDGVQYAMERVWRRKGH